MLRKQALLRREYLKKKTLTDLNRDRLERKIRIREALEKGTPIHDKDLKEEAFEKEYGFNFSQQHQLEQNQSENKKNEMKNLLNKLDDEYSEAGRSPPKVLITTSQEASDPLKRFAKELKIIFPISSKINRGNHGLDMIINSAIKNGFTDVVIVNETKGVPSRLIVSHLPYGPTAFFSIFNIVTRNEALQTLKTDGIKINAPENPPHLIFHNFKTDLGKRLTSILKFLFPIPKKDSKRVVTFYNSNDFISFRNHVYLKENKKLILKEIGPRFELMLYKIILGTVNNKQAEEEWILHNFTNTAHKKQLIGISDEDLLAIEEEERYRIQI